MTKFMDLLIVAIINTHCNAAARTLESRADFTRSPKQGYQ